jgi:chromosome segregation ATPase
MKKFLSNLLIFFSLALCGLIAFQWVREAHLRAKIQSLTDTIHDKSETIQSLQGQLKKSEAGVTRLDKLKSELTETVKSNRVEIAGLKKDVEKADKEIEKQSIQIDNYKAALETANASIKKQQEDIKKQNEDLKKLVEERNATVAKFNKLADEYNDLVNKWNKQQEEISKGATNAPAKK